jgi:hypothetical protein
MDARAFAGAGAIAVVALSLASVGFSQAQAPSQLPASPELGKHLLRRHGSSSNHGMGCAGQVVVAGAFEVDFSAQGSGDRQHRVAG